MSRGGNENGSRKVGFFGLVPLRRKSNAQPTQAATPPTQGRETADEAVTDAAWPPPPSATVDEAASVETEQTWSILGGLPMTSRAASLGLSDAEKRRAWVAEPAVRAKPAPEPAASAGATAHRAEEMASGLRRMSREHRKRAAVGRLNTNTELLPAPTAIPTLAAGIAGDPNVLAAAEAEQAQAQPVRAVRTRSVEDAPIADTAVKPARKPARAPSRRRNPKPAPPQAAVAAPAAKVPAKTLAADRSGDVPALDLGAMSVRQLFGRLRDGDATTTSVDAAAEPSAGAAETAPAKWPTFFRKTDRT